MYHFKLPILYQFQMPLTVRIKIATEFSPTPGGRYIQQGELSGELFRVQFLADYFINDRLTTDIVIDLNGIVGMAESFIDEAFTELVRKYGKQVLEHFTFVSDDDPLLVEKILKEMKEVSN